jgi:competence ComEA-like helix-hairpin-helix protein
MLTALTVVLIVFGMPGSQGVCIAQPDSPPQKVEKLDINEATVEQLAKLPGMNEFIAKIIIDYRTANGPFQSVNDLRKFKHMRDNHRWKRIKDLVTVN